MPAADKTVGSTGEFRLIDSITARLTSGPAVSVGPGDDAAVFLVNGSAVSSVDVLVEGVHFRRDWISAEQLGHRALAAAASDIEAMGADLVAVLVGLSVPADLETSWVDAFTRGLAAEAETASASVVGGDITSARDITISMTVIGELKGRTPLLRSGAEPGQAVAVRGRLGWAAGGLAVLSRGFRSPRALVDAYQRPQVSYGVGAAAHRAGATSMIDVSDGLLADLGHIATASDVCIELEVARFDIPEPLTTISAALGTDPLDFVLTGGEDHALAATFPIGSVPPDWHVIGLVTNNDPAVLVDGNPYQGSQGWDHFGN